MSEIRGDRTNGNNATAPRDVEEQVGADVQCSQHNTLNLDNNDDAQDDTIDGASATGDAPPNPNVTPSTTSGVRMVSARETTVVLIFIRAQKKLVDNLTNMCKARVPYLATLTAVLSQESVCNKEKPKEMRKIQGLSYKEWVMTSYALTANSQHAVLFLDTPDEEKADFVADLCGFTR